MKVYKENIVREIDDSKLENYLAAGWSRDEVKAEVIKLKPAAKSKGAVQADPDNAIQQGDE
jgi:hypothetical protein